MYLATEAALESALEFPETWPGSKPAGAQRRRDRLNSLLVDQWAAEDDLPVTTMNRTLPRAQIAQPVTERRGVCAIKGIGRLLAAGRLRAHDGLAVASPPVLGRGLAGGQAVPPVGCARAPAGFAQPVPVVGQDPGEQRPVTEPAVPLIPDLPAV